MCSDGESQQVRIIGEFPGDRDPLNDKGKKKLFKGAEKVKG